MPRLDAARLGAWRELSTLVVSLTRGIDEDLAAEWDIPLAWFDVLSALQRLGGRARPVHVAELLKLPPSSLSRRLDRLEEEGWIARHRYVDPGDGRAVEIELTRRGRNLWREMNVSYRRAVQAHFASHLDDEQITAMLDLVDRLTFDPAEVDAAEDD